MIAAPVIGAAPTPELTLAAGPKADAEATAFASILKAVAPVGQGMAVQIEPQSSHLVQPVDADLTATTAPVPEAVQPGAQITKSAIPTPIVITDLSKTDCAEVVVQGDGLPVALKANALTAAPAKEVPEKVASTAKQSSDDELLRLDQILSEPAELPNFPKLQVEHRVGEVPVAVPSPEKQIALPQIAAPSAEQVVAGEVSVPKYAAQIDRVEVQVSAPTEPRGAPALGMSVADKSQSTFVERGPVFAPMLMQIARDVMALSADRDVRFNVRPDILGPVAVTIERTDAGPSLRLGVESHSAVQAVRAAEPLLNDSRGAAPFVQVTVDMNAPDQRSRQSRAPVPPRRLSEQTYEILTERATVAAGRFA